MKVTELFRKKTNPTGVFYNTWEHTGWGNRLEITDHYRANGHLPFYLKPGDEIRTKMESGKVGRYLIKSVNQCLDPRDMFFAEISPIGYLDRPAERGFLKDVDIDLMPDYEQ